MVFFAPTGLGFSPFDRCERVNHAVTTNECSGGEAHSLYQSTRSHQSESENDMKNLSTNRKCKWTSRIPV